MNLQNKEWGEKIISKFNESILMGNLQEIDEFVFNLYLFINMLHL